MKKTSATKMPLYESFKTNDNIRVDRTEITKKQYHNFKKELPPIHIAEKEGPGSFFTPCMYPDHLAIVKNIFAVPKVEAHTLGTVVLMVCYKEVYGNYVKDKGWQTYKPDAYFKQLMQVYTPSFMPLSVISDHYGKKGYLVRFIYTEKEKTAEA